MSAFLRLALPMALAVLMATAGLFSCQERDLAGYFADPNSPPPTDAEYLFTQAAANATVQLLNDTDCNLLITFNGAQKFTTWFTDRPNRLAGWMSMRDFVDDFDGYFDDSFPNAVIYTPNLVRSQPADGSVFPVSVPVTLCSSEYDPDTETLSYTVRLLSFYPPGIGSPALGNSTLADINILGLADELVSATLQTPGIYIDGVVAWETEFCFATNVNATEPVQLTTSIDDAAQWKTKKIVKSKRADPQSEINGQVVQPNSTFCTSLFVDKQHAQPEGHVGATGIWFGLTVTGTVSGTMYQSVQLRYYGWERNCESSFDIHAGACKDPFTGNVIDCPIQANTLDTSAICADGPKDDPIGITGFTYQWRSASCKKANIKAIFKYTGIALATIGLTLFTAGIGATAFIASQVAASAAGAAVASAATLQAAALVGGAGVLYDGIGIIGGVFWGAAAGKINQCS